MRNLVSTILFTLLALYGSAQSIADIVNVLPDKKQKADTLRHFGRKYHMRAMPDSAGYYYTAALSYAREINDNDRIVQLYTLISKVRQMQKEPEKALTTIRNALPYIDNSVSSSVIENYYYSIANYFRILSKFDSALYYYRKTEEHNNRLYPYGNWYVYDGMAEIFLANNNLEKAEEYYLKAYSLTSKKGIRMDHGLIINRLGTLYSKMKDPAKFAVVLEEHERFIKSGKRDFRKDPVHSILFINWGSVSLADKVSFLNNVKKIHIANSFLQGAALANYHIASLYEAAGQPEAALKYLYENQDSLISKSVPADVYPNLQYIYKLELKSGKHENALKTANQLLDLNVKLADLANRELVTELETKYETEKKDKEISLLSASNKLKALELLREAEKNEALSSQNTLKDSIIYHQGMLALFAENQKQMQAKELENEKKVTSLLSAENILKQELLLRDKKRSAILWGGVGLLALAALIISFQYHRQVSKNRIIVRQREELEILNREIHHRVKNNLQIISSLLDLQSEASNDPRTAEKFLEGSQRVQSMAYIHQNLYQGENTESVDIQQYISMLTGNLLQSYQAGNITLTSDIEALKLHSDTVIPLGMIINELVSNALKYAFKNNDNGEIKVVLKKINEKLLLQVRDNGIGIPKDVDVSKGNSFGYRIISAFAKKLHALITINNEKGTDVQILISKFKPA